MATKKTAVTRKMTVIFNSAVRKKPFVHIIYWRCAFYQKRN